MTELFEEFSSRNMEDVFLENLEPFILTEKLWKYSINEDILRWILNYYISKNDYENLEKVILCLSFESD